jgi:hypothetical protein
MLISLVKVHDKTKGPEAHQCYVFNLQSETPGEGHSPTIFTYQGEQYRAFRTYAQVKPVVKDKLKHPVAQVVAVKVADEEHWAKHGKKGKLSPEMQAKLAQHVAK